MVLTEQLQDTFESLHLPHFMVLFFPQVNGWDMTMVTHDQARKRLTKRNEEVVRLLVTRQSLQKAVQQSMMS